jgi:hypothetical protein
MGGRAAIRSISSIDILVIGEYPLYGKNPRMYVYGPPKEDPDVEPKHQTRDAGTMVNTAIAAACFKVRCRNSILYRHMQ